MRNLLRYSSIVASLATAVLALGFAFQAGWATRLWPWPDGRLSYIFYGSILAAISAPVLWIALRGEWGAAAGGCINLAVTFAGMSALLLWIYRREHDAHLLKCAIAFGIFSLYSIGFFAWSNAQPIRDQRPMPLPVRVSFAIFSVVLIAVGIALLRLAPTIFPWPLKPDSSRAIGLIFLGASLYFIWGLFRTRWHEARGQLYGFLAYDIVLLPPYLMHFRTVKSEHQLSLIVYVTVLVYSTVLATYYLFINRSTRTR